jgi:hypothetical protein
MSRWRGGKGCRYASQWRSGNGCRRTSRWRSGNRRHRTSRRHSGSRRRRASRWRRGNRRCRSRGWRGRGPGHDSLQGSSHRVCQQRDSGYGRFLRSLFRRRLRHLRFRAQVRYRSQIVGVRGSRESARIEFSHFFENGLCFVLVGEWPEPQAVAWTPILHPL